MSNPFLSGLGVSLIDQASKPSTVTFPNKFNPYGSSVWAVVVRALPDELLVAEAWGRAIENYVDLCQETNVHPFKVQENSNQKLTEHLTRCRTELLVVLEQVIHPLLDQYSILEIDRKCELSHRGFELTVEAVFKNEDPTFAQHLAQLGFGAVNSSWTKRISQHSALKFSALQGLNSRWQVCYSVTGPMLPELPKLLATKEQLERFMVNGIWMPFTKDARPNHQGPRFI